MIFFFTLDTDLRDLPSISKEIQIRKDVTRKESISPAASIYFFFLTGNALTFWEKGAHRNQKEDDSVFNMH